MDGDQIFTVHALLRDAAERFGPATAVTDDRQTVTFEQLRDRAAAAAAALRAQGVGRGDRVGVCTGKSVDQVVAVLAILLADAILVPILPALKHDNIVHIVRDSGMRIAVADRERSGELTTAAPEVQLVDVTELARPAADPASALASLPQQAIGRDLAGIIYSSGSTGRPKGIMVTHRNLTDGARITARYLGIRRTDRIGSLLSLNFDYGLNQLWQVLHTGAALYLHELVFPESAFEFFARHRITVLPVMPVIVTRLFDPRLLRRRLERDLSAVRVICTSGGAVSSRMLDELAGTFPQAEIYLMYGLTEAFRSTYLPPAELRRRPGSIGRAIPDVEILVVDDDGRDVPPGTPGELVHRGGCVSAGYWQAPEETARRFRTLDRFPGEVVVFSGDLVTRDADGYLYFLGRRDAMIKTSGFRVSPTEVEESAARFPGVQACVAVGVPNIEIGEDIVLVYTADDGIDEAEFRRFLARQLPGHMTPHRLLRWTSLPATGNAGKIDRQAVREAVLSAAP